MNTRICVSALLVICASAGLCAQTYQVSTEIIPMYSTLYKLAVTGNHVISAAGEHGTYVLNLDTKRVDTSTVVNNYSLNFISVGTARGDTCFAGTTSGLLRSTNAGKYWDSIIPGDQVQSLTSQNERYIARGDQRGLISRYSVETDEWSLVDESGFRDPAQIGCDASGAIVVADFGVFDVRVYDSTLARRSNTNFDNYPEDVHIEDGGFVLALFEDFDEGTTYVHTSTDYGLTWTEVAVIPARIRAMTSPRAGYYVAIGNDDTMAISTDHGVTWELLQLGISNAYFNDVEYISDSVFVIGGSGMFVIVHLERSATSVEAALQDTCTNTPTVSCGSVTICLCQSLPDVGSLTLYRAVDGRIVPSDLYTCESNATDSTCTLFTEGLPPGLYLAVASMRDRQDSRLFIVE